MGEAEENKPLKRKRGRIGGGPLTVKFLKCGQTSERDQGFLKKTHGG